MIRDAEIEAQLQRILGSSAFVSSARSKQFLEFCVDRARHGEASQIKETTITVAVFQRAADYDPKSDPIVRVHARRVRERLDLYYRTTGTHDPITINLPKGGMFPLSFARFRSERQSSRIGRSRSRPESARRDWFFPGSARSLLRSRGTPGRLALSP